MSGHWSDSYVQFLRKIVPELDVPIYLLRNDEHPVEWEPHWLAIFSPLADLKAQSTIESLGLWSGRGCCITVRDDFAAWSARCQAGTLLHEMAHAIEHISQGMRLRHWRNCHQLPGKCWTAANRRSCRTLASTHGL